MSEQILPFRQRLVGKMVLFGIIPTVCLVGLIIGGNVVRAYALFGEQVERELADSVLIAAAELDLESQRASMTAELLGRAEMHAGLLGNRAGTEQLLRGIFEAHPELQAIGVAYEPTALAPSSGGSAAVATTEASERFTAELRRDRGGPPGGRMETEVDASHEVAYREAKRRVERDGTVDVLFAKPVKHGDTAAVRQAFPLVRDGRFVGVATVDRTLAAIEATLAAMGQRIGGDLYLAADGQFLAATTDSGSGADHRLQMASVVGSPLERVMETYVESPGAVRVVEGNDATLGADCYYGITKLRFGDWTLVVRKSKSGVATGVWATLLANSASGAIGVAAIALVLVLLARGVGQRLERVVVAAKRIADGNLSEPLPSVGVADESGTLLDAFEQMTRNLNRIVGQVRHASIQINSTATELAATSVTLESTASGFGASAAEVAAATRQISTTGDELLHTMQTVADSAAGAAEKAQESRNGLRSMQTSVRRLDDAAHSVAARLGAINEKAQAINAIVGAITKVADETNLLSVNAAIEAEKAGEFGLGFLIVAREIRRLADQTAAATVDIERMIRQMQGAVAAGVVEMDRFGDSLRTVLDDVDHVGQRVQGIIAHVEDDTIRFVQVTEGMRSQAAGAKQIDEAMRTLSVGARQTIETAGEFGSAANELQTAIGSLKSAVAMMRLREGN